MNLMGSFTWQSHKHNGDKPLYSTLMRNSSSLSHSHKHTQLWLGRDKERGGASVQYNWISLAGDNRDIEGAIMQEGAKKRQF